MGVAVTQPDVIAGAPPAVAPPPGNPRFPLFDSLRAIAALSVFAAHSIGLAEVGGDLGKYSGEFSRTGVCVFFLISGFLLYRPFVADRWKGGAGPRFRDFARRRLLRIVPAYWVALTLVALYYGQGVTTGNWWRFAVFGQVYRSETFSNGIGPAWTLCVEMTFYAVLPVLALVAGRVAGRSLLRNLGFLALLAAGSLAFHAHFVNEGNYEVASMLPGTFLWFALGMSLAVLSVAADTPRLSTLVGRRPTLCWATAIALFGILLSQYQNSGYSGSLREFVLCGLVAFFLLLPAVFGDDQGGLPRRVLALPALAWVGLISYGLYLWHYYVLLYVHQSEALHPLAKYFPLHVLLGLAGALAFGAASYYLVERPVLRWKNVRLTRLFRRSPASTRGPSAERPGLRRRPGSAPPESRGGA